MNQRVRQEDRRSESVSHKHILEAVDELKLRVVSVEKKIERVKIPEEWNEILRDVAAVGRFGRLLGRVVLWGTPIVGAVIAAWHFVFGGGASNG